jgi:monoamine oxidase
MNCDNYENIVIGAGLAGLNTCYQIKKLNKNSKTLLIEKEEYLGGRIQSVYLPNHQFYETGGIRFYPSHKNILRLLEKFGYKKKDFIVLKTKDLVKDIILINNKQIKVSEYDLNKELINHKKEFDKDYLLTITFETYARKILGKDKYNYLKSINGFPHIFTYTSAEYGLKLLERDFINIEEFYLLKTPLSDFVYKIAEYLTLKKCKIKVNEEFLNYKKENNNYIIKTTKGIYKCKNLIFALPLIPLKKILGKQVDLVNPIPLSRIFASFPNDNYWHKDLNFTYTDNKIQRIFTKNSDMIQISYSSGKNAEYWESIDNTNLPKEIVSNLKKMFKRKYQIKEPNYVDKNYWEGGIHLWKKNVNGDEITKTILKPFENENIFICNEAFSKNQRWMEGAIEMSNRVASLL